MPSPNSLWLDFNWDPKYKHDKNDKSVVIDQGFRVWSHTGCMSAISQNPIRVEEGESPSQSSSDPITNKKV